MKKPREFSNPKYTQISLYVVLTFIALLVTYAIKLSQTPSDVP